MKTTLASLLLAGLIIGGCGSAWSAELPSHWQIDKTKSHLEFSGSEGGKEFKGEFKSFDCEIAFDKDSLSASSVKVVIDTSSVVTGNKVYDDALPGTDWFSVKAFPNAVFTSTSVKQPAGAAANLYEAVGTVNMLGHQQPLVLPFSLQDLSDDGKLVRATGQFTLKRLDFSLGKAVDASGDMVSNDVVVSFDITAQRK